MSRKPSFQRWSDLVNCGDGAGLTHMSQADCRSLKKLLSNRPANAPQEAWMDLAVQVYELAESKDITIDPEHETKGKEWFAKQKRKILKDQPPADLRILEELYEHGIKQFFFGGYMDSTAAGGGNPNYSYAVGRRGIVPIWKVLLNNGTRFSYAYGAWQGYDKVILHPAYEV